MVANILWSCYHRVPKLQCPRNMSDFQTCLTFVWRLPCNFTVDYIASSDKCLSLPHFAYTETFMVMLFEMYCRPEGAWSLGPQTPQGPEIPTDLLWNFTLGHNVSPKIGEFVKYFWWGILQNLLGGTLKFKWLGPQILNKKMLTESRCWEKFWNFTRPRPDFADIYGYT